MHKISELKHILGKSFSWNKSRLDCFAKMLLSLIAVRTVNLSEIAVGFASKTQVSSRYKRLYRFFRSFKIDYGLVAIWVFKLFFPASKVYLTIDRTNWFWGKAKLNMLTLGMAYEGIAIPLLWQFLNKAGNATAQEHQAIITRFVELFGKKSIAGILCDREFASGYLFGWCNANEIRFYIRIKEGSMVRVKGKKLYPAERLFRQLNPKQHTVFHMDVELFGQKVYLSGSRSEKGELMIVATNCCPKTAIAIYLRRWEIETLFSCLKGRGFNFEDTHLTKLERIEKLMVVLVVAFCWAHKTGEWQASKKSIVFKKHKDGQIRPQNSLFRYGLDFIREIILSPFHKMADFKRCLTQLVPIPCSLEAVL